MFFWTGLVFSRNLYRTEQTFTLASSTEKRLAWIWNNIIYVTYGLGQYFQDLGHSFSPYGPPSRQITYIYILLGSAAFKNWWQIFPWAFSLFFLLGIHIVKRFICFKLYMYSKPINARNRDIVEKRLTLPKELPDCCFLLLAQYQVDKGDT